MITRWRHLCISLNFATKNLLAVDSNQIVINRTMDFELNNMTRGFNESVTRICIMKNTRQGKNSLNSKGSLVGKLTDMNIYREAMTVKEMLAWTQCGGQPSSGDLLAWDQAEWYEENLNATEENLEEICLLKSELVVVPPARQTDAVDICVAIGGSVTGVDELRSGPFWQRLESEQCKGPHPKPKRLFYL